MVTCEDQEYPQARPNVIFELGWFYGRLGRDRVAILFKQGTKIHSDLDGICHIKFNDAVDEIVPDMERELVAAKILAS
jgi:predicted nucleotide-binding protein